MIIAGVVRELTGGLPHVVPGAGAVGIGSHSGLIAIGAVYIMAKAFANGGSSLTGIEAVSNAVSALRPPEGRHARQILATQGTIVAVLIAGISWLAHITHAIPYTAGFPTVLAQEAGVVFGHTAIGQAMFFVLQAGTAAILFTGGNTSFTGFPFLASFVAEDSFLPRWLGRRGHRLAFSNGIIVLAALSVALMLVAGATVDALIPFYAIGVFTGFAMAGFGMARHNLRTREPGWRRALTRTESALPAPPSGPEERWRVPYADRAGQAVVPASWPASVICSTAGAFAAASLRSWRRLANPKSPARKETVPRPKAAREMM
jgi:amino acid transporter